VSKVAADRSAYSKRDGDGALTGSRAAADVALFADCAIRC